MAFTRFHDDTARIEKQLEQSTFQGRYFLDTPGPSAYAPFMEDVQIRLQKWGANLYTEKTNLESNLRNQFIPLNRDSIPYDKKKPNSIEILYHSTQPFIEETRATHPAWMYKDLEQNRWETPFENPQENFECKFPTLINARDRTMCPSRHWQNDVSDISTCVSCGSNVNY